MTTLLAIDFDGTLATHDTLDWLSAHWVPDDFEAADAALARGEIGLDECMSRQVANITATHDEIVAFLVDTVRLRAGTPELIAFCAEHDVEPVVVSSGFTSLIRPIMDAEGVDLPIVAHEVEHVPGGMRIAFSERALCDHCGERCKRSAVDALARGRRVAYVGDGHSDLCVSEVADLRFARAGLARHLDEGGFAYTPFEDMHDVRRGLADALGA